MFTICGFKENGWAHVARETLAEIPCPAETRTYKPVSHYRLATRVGELCGDLYDIENAEYLLSPDKQSLIGAYHTGRADNDMRDVVVYGHDLKKSTAVWFAVGAQVFVCSNGMITASWTARRKHTAGVEDFIEQSILSLGRRWDAQRESRDTLRRRVLQPHDANAMFMRLGRDGILPWNRVGDADAEYRSDEHHDKHGQSTAWSWYNAVTEVAKKLAIPRQRSAIESAYTLCLN